MSASAALEGAVSGYSPCEAGKSSLSRHGLFFDTESSITSHHSASVGSNMPFSTAGARVAAARSIAAV